MASESHCGAAFWSDASFFFVESYYLQCAIMNSACTILPRVVHRRNKQFNRRRRWSACSMSSLKDGRPDAIGGSSEWVMSFTKFSRATSSLD
jgi:hypothetical protein